MTEPINRFDVRQVKRTLQRPEFVPSQMKPWAVGRELTYRVVSARGPIGAQTFPNAQAALVFGHEHKPRGLWWVETVVGVE